MTNFTDLNSVLDILIQYFTGTESLLALLLSLFVLLIFLARGIDFRYASIFILPLLGLFTAIGWFGDVDKSQWIVNSLLMVIAIFYAWAVIKFMS